MAWMNEITHQSPRNDQEILAHAKDLWRFEGERRVDHGGSCRVWNGKGPDQRSIYLKCHPEPRSWNQERKAITTWLPKIPQGLANQPELIASDEKSRLLLLSAVPGKSIESRSWSSRELHNIHLQAGIYLNELHRLETSEDDVPLMEVLPKRLEAWISKADGILKEDQIEKARECFEIKNLFSEDRRTPCHNDYQPRNWLWDGEKIGVIDWEHSRLNHPAYDLVRLKMGAWKEDPRLRESFLAGYGQTPDWLIDERMDAIVILFAIGCIVWGAQHQQPDLVDLGNRCLSSTQGETGS